MLPLLAELKLSRRPRKEPKGEVAVGEPERPKVVNDMRLRWAWAAAFVMGPGYWPCWASPLGMLLLFPGTLRGAEMDGRPLPPNMSAMKEPRLVRGGDWVVEVGSSAIAVAGERMTADGRTGVAYGAATGKRVVCGQRVWVWADADQRPTGANVISLWEREGVCVVVFRYGVGVRGCKGFVVSASFACGKKVGRRHRSGGRKGRWEWEWRLEDEMSRTREQYATK